MGSEVVGSEVDRGRASDSTTSTPSPPTPFIL